MFDEIGHSLLGYMDIAIYFVFNWSYYIGMAMGAFKSRESYKYFADGQVRVCKRGLNLAHWYTIYSQAYPMQGLTLTPVC